jgi:hypothetical protein
MLDYIKDIILYTEKGKEIQGEKRDEETEEYKDLLVASMISPEIVKGFGKLWRGLTISPISQFSLLESKYSVEMALNFAESYRNKIEDTRGNKIRWKNLLNLIAEPFDGWLKDLTAEIKDIELRYKSSIGKEEVSITEDNVKSRINAEEDFLQQWSLQEKKNVLEKLGRSFQPIDQLIIELRKKNKFFLNTESFKTLKVEKGFEMAVDHINFIESVKEKIANRVIQLKENLGDLNQEILRIDKESEEKLASKQAELSQRLDQRNSRIQEMSSEGKVEIEKRMIMRNLIEEKFQEIKLILDKKVMDCDNDLRNLLMAGIPNSIIGEGMPVQRLFLPVYAALLEDEEEDERLVFAFPSIVKENFESSLLEEFSILSTKTSQVMEDDMKIRSNFEFTMEKLNLLKAKNTEKLLRDGFELLVIKGLANKAISDHYIQEFLNI